MVCRGWPASEFSYVASNIRVAGGKENAFSQRSLSNMQIARHVLFGVNIKSEALHNRSLQSIDGHRGVERLQALPKDRPELSSGFGIVSERGDILAYSLRGIDCTSIRERHPLPLCQFAALGRLN